MFACSTLLAIETQHPQPINIAKGWFLVWIIYYFQFQHNLSYLVKIKHNLSYHFCFIRVMAKSAAYPGLKYCYKNVETEVELSR